MAYRFSATDRLGGNVMIPASSSGTDLAMYGIPPAGSQMLSDKLNKALNEVWGNNVRIGTKEEVYNIKTWR